MHNFWYLQIIKNYDRVLHLLTHPIFLQFKIVCYTWFGSRLRNPCSHLSNCYEYVVKKKILNSTVSSCKASRTNWCCYAIYFPDHGLKTIHFKRQEKYWRFKTCVAGTNRQKLQYFCLAARFHLVFFCHFAYVTIQYIT